MATATKKTPRRKKPGVKKRPGAKAPIAEKCNDEELRKEFPVEVSRIKRDTTQPRVHFDQGALQGLADSIAEIGMIEPIKLIRLPKGGRYDWIIDDGERRWRAHKMLKRKIIRAVELVVDNKDDAFVYSIAANFNRESHTPIEIAKAIKRLKQMGKSRAQMQAIFGKSDYWICQYDSINKVPEEVQKMMDVTLPEKDRLKVPIVQLLAPLEGRDELQIKLARTIVEKRYSVKKAKVLIRQAADEVGVNPYRGKRTPGRDYNQVRTFIEGLLDQLPLFNEMPDGQFEKMFETRGDIEIGVLIDQIKQAHEDLESLGDLVREIYKKKYKKEYGK